MLIRLTQRQGLGIFLLLTGVLLFAGQYWYFNLRPQDTLLPLAQSHLSGMQDNIQGFLLANPDFKKNTCSTLGEQKCLVCCLPTPKCRASFRIFAYCKPVGWYKSIYLTKIQP
jgi:hypothetical protein